MKEVVVGNKEAYRTMCQNTTKENKNRYERMRNKEKNAASKAMRGKAHLALTK